MITFKFLGFTFVVYVSNTVNMLVTDIFLNTTNQEDFIFIYCRYNSTPSVTRYVLRVFKTKKQREEALSSGSSELLRCISLKLKGSINMS